MTPKSKMGGRAGTAFQAVPTRHKEECLCHCRGQVLAILLLSIVMLMALVFFVYNLGWQVNRRLDVQNTSDAVAVGGGVWMARSMNVIAADNMSVTRMLALVPVMDSLPLATKMSHEETAAWADRLTEQVKDLQPTWKDSKPCPSWLQDGLQSLQERMVGERDILAAMDQQLDPDQNGDSFHMEDTTYWADPKDDKADTPHGALWKAARTLDELSQATASSAGVLAQAAAVQSGEQNGMKAAFIVPILPRLPAKRGVFHDFQPPLQGRESVIDTEATAQATGGSGGAIPDMAYPHRLGPWARLYQWRSYMRKATAREWVPGSSGYAVGRRGGGGNFGGGGRSVGNSANSGPGGGATGGRWRATAWETYGYTTYGPLTWALNHVRDWAIGWWELADSGWIDHTGQLPDTFFYSYLNTLAKDKSGYMFTFNPQLKSIHYPKWITSYDEARSIAAADRSRIRYTMLYCVEIVSTAPENGPGWMSAGTYRTNSDRPRATWWRRWKDPAGLEQVADYVWKDTWEYETNYDPEIGIDWQGPADGEGVYRKVYVVDYYVWGGIDVGENVEVTNPCNYTDDADLPAPVLLDAAEGDYDPGAAPFQYTAGNPPPPDPDAGWRGDRFSFLGVAVRAASSEVWPRKFGSVNPIGSSVALAEVKVYNNRSWDLWTQDWQASLTPTRNWSNWMERLQTGVADVGLTQLLNSADVQEIYEYLDKIPPEQADLYIRH